MTTAKALIAIIFGSFLVAAPAFALSVSAAASANANVAPTPVSAGAQTKLATAKSRADQEIMRRITILTQLNTDVQAMAKVSSSEKTAIANEVQTEISNLNSLNVKIQADTDIATLKSDVQSITIGYRIFMLVVPQGRIEVAADKIETIASNYTTLAATLQTRISQAPAATDRMQVNTWLSDMKAKVAGANVQAQNAASLAASLQPDQGNATVEASNKTALQSARADIKAALADLKTARQDAGNIVKTVESWKVSTSASSTVNAQ